MAILHALALPLAFPLTGEVAAYALRLPVGAALGMALLLAAPALRRDLLALLLAWLRRASMATIASLAAQSVTTPVAMGNREESQITI